MAARGIDAAHKPRDRAGLDAGAAGVFAFGAEREEVVTPAHEAALIEELDRVARDGITAAECAKAQSQLTARLVLDNDSVTNIAHQLGYFDTIGAGDAPRALPRLIAEVTLDEVAAVAREVFVASNRTIGWFDPLPIGRPGA